MSPTPAEAALADVLMSDVDFGANVQPDCAAHVIARLHEAGWALTPAAPEAIRAALERALPDALSAMTEGGEETEAPEPSDESGSAYVIGLAAHLASSLAATPEPLDARAKSLDLPPRIVVDARGFYWRDYGGHYSMCPVSDDNEPVKPAAVYLPDVGLDSALLADAMRFGVAWRGVPSIEEWPRIARLVAAMYDRLRAAGHGPWPEENIPLGAWDPREEKDK